MKTTLFDVLYDGLTDIKWKVIEGKEQEAKEIIERLQDYLIDFKIMRYLDALHLDYPKMVDTCTEYGWIKVEKNNKEGAIII